MELGKAVVRRYWDADGPSHTRALAYHSMLVLLSGLIGFIGVASVLELPVVRTTVEEWLRRISPGPSGRILSEAVQQGAAGGGVAVLGLGTALAVGTRAMAQFQRAADRLLGITEDRPFVRRYLVGAGLVASAGLLLAIGALTFVGGEAIASGAGWRSDLAEVWSIVRWPLGAAVAALAIIVLYRLAPRARPATRPLVGGAATAIVLWLAFSGLLVAYFSLSDRSSRTYGPLIGFVALLLWAAFASLALHLGLAVTAELSSSSASRPRSR
jgi:membrane protein